MKNLAAAMLAACVACACSSAPESTVRGPASASAGVEVNEIAFTCEGGQSLRVRFYPTEDRAVMVRNGEEIELPQQVSASGFIYSNGPNTIYGKGDELTVEIGRMAPLQCRAS